jgi:hypothetical protein
MAWVTGIPRATNYKCPRQNAPGFSAANGRIVWLIRLWLLYHYPLIQGTAWRTSLVGLVSEQRHSQPAVTTLSKLTHDNLSQKNTSAFRPAAVMRRVVRTAPRKLSFLLDHQRNWHGMR